MQKTFVVGPFQCNCRLVACPNTLSIEYLIHTHGHLDHIGGTRGLVEAAKADRKSVPKIALHRDDHPLYLALKTQGQLFGMSFSDPLPVDLFLQDEEELKIGDLRLSVIHTPGHSPGSVCFRLHEDSSTGVVETLFSGDTLFNGSVGRTDLWGASQEQMFRSIRSRILVLDGDTALCPGHGPDSSIGIEKKTNPFLK
ncbi:MAG: MBL fold metallo-hydrolase [Bdellovibrio sp.]|nr:MBL fold metallo-hydrolase [Bdellovibrio sp.]